MLTILRALSKPVVTSLLTMALLFPHFTDVRTEVRDPESACLRWLVKVGSGTGAQAARL